MDFTTPQIVSWILVGLIAGPVAGLVLKRRRRGFGWLGNVGLGLAGALVGGLLFSLLGWDFGLGEIVVSLADVIQAFLGALLLVGAVLLARTLMARRAREREAAPGSDPHRRR